jgi:ribose transport system substrate-binding protein
MYVDQGHISEQVTGSAETLAAAGCDGIIICNSASAEMASVIKTCTKSKVYCAQFFRIIDQKANPIEYKFACQSPYYVGAVQWNKKHPSDKAVMFDPQYGGTTSDTGRATAEAIINSHADADALIVAGGGGDTLVGALAAIEAKGLKGKIKVVSTDFLADLDKQLATGGMAAESGGHYCDPLFAFMLVYNAVKENYKTSTNSFYSCWGTAFAAVRVFWTGIRLPFLRNIDRLF